MLEILKSQNNSSFTVCSPKLVLMSDGSCERGDLHVPESPPTPSVPSYLAQGRPSPGGSAQLVGIGSCVSADNPFKSFCLISPHATLLLRELDVKS